ncbi:hypothetical protein F5X96DRAFT_687373 [Biscogniauxia mediterranea]|nr:hypothetical protein F5X96DRAFT_687373 [Biscogniauxia mediterranea]
MLFTESDAPLLKTWIVNRLANTSDADADVLADYVLALLRHDGDIDTIRKLFEEEIPDFLREDAAAFTDDVFQAVKYRSYLPGAPPPPPIIRQPRPQKASAPIQIPPRADLQPQFAAYSPASASAPAGPAFPQGGPRKRTYNDRDDNDVDTILTGRNQYGGGVGAAQPYKQARRAGFSQRGGRFDDPYGGRTPRGGPNPYQPSATPSRFGAPPAFPPAPNAQGLPPLDPNSIMENIQRLQQLGIPIPQMPELPRPVYSGPAIPPRRRKPRCRDYDTKGYCSRGSNCNFEHGTESLYVPPFQLSAGDEYDPNNASLPPMPTFGNQSTPQPLPALDLSSFQQMTPPTTNRREPKKPKRAKGRPAFASNGPNHDRSKTAIVVQNIPSENFTDDQIRGYFSQFGDIEDLTIHSQDRLAIIKYDTWEAAHAAWSSPKVIFDNRFVKVFWHKDENEDATAPNGKPVAGAKNGASNGSSSVQGNASEEPEFDMEDFKRKQEEAQKIYKQKMEKRQEIERQRQELEERQKELIAKQLEEKRRLQAKLAGSSAKDGSKSPTQGKADGTGKPSTQTEALRAQLAALEAEANVLGIDPEQEEGSTWPPRGRGRGRGYRGLGTFPPRASRGSYGYRGRGGGGVEARHAAYAAFSLDNRPKIVALSGVDFTIPERDEALRQYLFGIGEFTDVHTDPAVTHVTFKDRKTAEKFMFGISASNTIPGVEEKFEPSWANSAPLSDTAAAAAAAAADSDLHMTSGLEDEQAAKDKGDVADGSTTAGLEDGEIANDRDQGDMDYEPGDDWGIS